MQQLLSGANSYRDLLALDRPSVNFKEIFNDEGFFQKKLCRQKFILLKVISPVLDTMIVEGENIHYLSYGMLNKIMEQLIGGWAMMYLNRHAFVFTSKRILFIQLKGRFKLNRLRMMLEYSSIEKTRTHLFGSISIMLNSGKKLNFVGVPRSDRKFIHQNIRQITSIIPMAKKNLLGIRNLCPKCGIPVESFPRLCPGCSAKYKSPLKAALLSLVFPGLGDIYLGHMGFGLMEITGAFLVWVIIVLPILASSAGAVEILVIFIGTVLLMHVPDALFTAYVARKGIYAA